MSRKSAPHPLGPERGSWRAETQSRETCRFRPGHTCGRSLGLSGPKLPPLQIKRFQKEPLEPPLRFEMLCANCFPRAAERKARSWHPLFEAQVQAMLGAERQHLYADSAPSGEEENLHPGHSTASETALLPSETAGRTCKAPHSDGGDSKGECEWHPWHREERASGVLLASWLCSGRSRGASAALRASAGPDGKPGACRPQEGLRLVALNVASRTSRL
nr:uncharacterized protein LOC116148062 [Camelus dromedarius]